MSMRVIAAFLLLPLAVGLERMAWFATRSAVYQRFTEIGADRAGAYSSTYVALLVGAVVAGVLAAAVLPRIVLVAAGVCCVTGYVIAGTASDGDTLAWGLRLAAAGAGAMKACLYGLALLVLPTPRLRTLYILLTYLVVNLASMIASPLGGWATSVSTSSLVLTAAGIAVALGLLPAVIFIAVDKLSSAAPSAATRGDPGRALGGAAVMAFATLPLWTAMAAASMRLFQSGDSMSIASLIEGAASALTMAALVALAVYLLSRGDRESAEPTPTSTIVGMCLAAGVAASLVACLPTLAAAAIAAAFFALAEVAAPLALARGLANQHPRVVTLVAALTLTFTWAGNAAAGAVGAVPALIGSAFFCAVGGGALIAMGRAFDAWLDAPMKPKPESWLNPP